MAPSAARDRVAHPPPTQRPPPAPPRPLASHPSPQAAGRHCSLGAQPRSRQQRRAAPSSSRLPSAMSTLPKSPPWCSAIEMRHFLSASSPALSLPLRCCGSPPAPPTSPPPSPPREHGARTELSRWFGRTGCKMRRGALEGGDRFPARQMTLYPAATSFLGAAAAARRPPTRRRSPRPRVARGLSCRDAAGAGSRRRLCGV